MLAVVNSTLQSENIISPCKILTYNICDSNFTRQPYCANTKFNEFFKEKDTKVHKLSICACSSRKKHLTNSSIPRLTTTYV